MHALIRVLARFASAVAIIGVATVARLLLDPYLGDNVPYITYFAAVALAAWYGGLGASLLALALGGPGADYPFIPPPYAVVPTRLTDYLGMGLYLGLGTGIALLCESLRAAHRRADERRELLRVTLASVGD